MVPVVPMGLLVVVLALKAVSLLAAGQVKLVEMVLGSAEKTAMLLDWELAAVVEELRGVLRAQRCL